MHIIKNLLRKISSLLKISFIALLFRLFLIFGLVFSQKKADKKSKLLISFSTFFTSELAIDLMSNIASISTVILAKRLLNFDLLLLNNLTLVLGKTIVLFAIQALISLRSLISLYFSVNKMKIAWPSFYPALLSY